MDELSSGMDELAVIVRPPRAGVVHNRFSVRGIFIPSETVQDNITVVGVTSRMNGVFHIRHTEIPAELVDIVKPGTFDVGPGWTLVVRGLRLRVVRSTWQGGELSFMLSDMLEDHGEPYQER